MKKTIFVACLAFCLLSTGCGSVTNNEAETASAVTIEATTGSTTETTETSDVTAADVTTQIASNASAEITPEPTSISVPDAETQSSTDQTAPTVEQAQELIRALNMVERLGGGGLPFDEGNVYILNGTAYYRVTDTDFANTAEIRSYVEKYLTQNMISERYSAIVDSDTPIYIDADNGLYMKDSAKGFYIFSDAEPNSEKTFEEGYSILAEYDNFGEKETADIRIVNMNGAWKICGISFGL